jgi:hypothetical protein
MYSINSWFENSALSLQRPELPLKSQNISNLHAKVGDSDILSIFMSKMLRNLGTKSALMYDFTSFSSYFQLINLLNTDTIEMILISLN